MPTTRTVTIKTSGGDYTSLAAMEAAENGNLVSLDRLLVVECYSMNDTGGSCVFDGWTTDATRYVIVKTPGTERHDGKWNTGKYRITNNDLTISVAGDMKILFEGLQVEITGAGLAAFWFIGSTTTIQIDNCIIRGASLTSTELYGVAALNACTLKIKNTICYDIVNGANFMAGFYFTSSVTVYCYNCTAQNCRIGFNANSGSPVCKNCVAQDCTSDGFGGTFGGSSTDNCSDFSSDAPGSNPETGEVLFADEANDDFHLSASDTVAKDKGADLSADANYPFSDDIDGATRSGSWDIGADEVTAAAAASLVFDSNRAMRPLLVR